MKGFIEQPVSSIEPATKANPIDFTWNLQPSIFDRTMFNLDTRKQLRTDESADCPQSVDTTALFGCADRST